MVTIRDPVHGSIALASWALPLVDSPVYQRLRRVSQLGTGALVYPGANHRRFEHGLGAYHLAGRISEAVGLDEQDARTARAAALLHDVGHGPFSHAFEEIQTGRRHEEMTVDLVRWGPLADLLRQGGLDPVAVGEAVIGNGRLAPLVSGSLDVDRMDYLLRDAHYTGVRSGADPDRLVEVVRRHDEHGIVLEESGVIAAEALLTTRFLLYPAVYLHHAVRASERMLQQAVVGLVEEGHASWSELATETDDGLLWRCRRAGGMPARMVRALDERRIYKRALEVGPERHGDQDIQALLDAPDARRALEQEVADAAGVEAHDVLLDVPPAPRFREMGLHVMRSGGPVPLGEASQLVRVLQEARLDHWRLRLFAPKGLRDKVARVVRKLL